MWGYAEGNATVVGIFEITSWLGSKGVKNVEPMNKGGTITSNGLRITMTDARHSSSFDDSGIVYLGEPAGFGACMHCPSPEARMGKYEATYRRSLADPEALWAEVAQGIRWRKKWDRVLDRSAAPIYRWFAGGELNTCENALDRHVEEGRADQLALVCDSPLAGQVERFTYRALRDEVARLAGALQRRGVEKGDRVLIYMPMTPEAVFAMLATVRIGAIHSVVFGGFAAVSLAARIDDAKPTVMVTSDAGMRMGKTIALKPLVDE